MYPESPKGSKWAVYPVGCAVFIGVLYFVLSRFFGLSAGASLAFSITGGILGFFAFAMIAENFESGGWDDGGA